MPIFFSTLKRLFVCKNFFFFLYKFNTFLKKLCRLFKDFFKYFGIKSVTELKNYLKSIEIDTAKLDALLAEDREEGANILFEDPNQESFDFTDDEIKINENTGDTCENLSESADEGGGANSAGTNENKDASGDDGDDDRHKSFFSEPEIPEDGGPDTVEAEVIPPSGNDLTVQADEPGAPLPEPEDEAQR